MARAKPAKQTAPENELINQHQSMSYLSFENVLPPRSSRALWSPIQQFIFAWEALPTRNAFSILLLEILQLFPLLSTGANVDCA